MTWKGETEVPENSRSLLIGKCPQIRLPVANSNEKKKQRYLRNQREGGENLLYTRIGVEGFGDFREQSQLALSRQRKKGEQIYSSLSSERENKEAFA